MVIELSELKIDKFKEEILAKREIRNALYTWAKDQGSHHAMWIRLQRVMLSNGLKHVSLPKLNIEVWLKAGRMIFDIVDMNAVSLDNCCPFCGASMMENGHVIYIHPGLNHERHVYGCTCGRFYTATWEVD